MDMNPPMGNDMDLGNDMTNDMNDNMGGGEPMDAPKPTDDNPMDDNQMDGMQTDSPDGDKTPAQQLQSDTGSLSHAINDLINTTSPEEAKPTIKWVVQMINAACGKVLDNKDKEDIIKSLNQKIQAQDPMQNDMGMDGIPNQDGNDMPQDQNMDAQPNPNQTMGESWLRNLSEVYSEIAPTTKKKKTKPTSCYTSKLSNKMKNDSPFGK